MATMTLLERVELAQGERAPERLEGDRLAKACRELQDALYRRLPSQRIAQLMGEDIVLASREVSGAIEALLKGSRFAGLSDAEREACAADVLDMVIGLGPIQRLIDDPTVTEIMANGPGAVFYEREGRIRPAGARFASEAQMRVVIDKILGPVGRRVDERNPMVSARLSGGHRVNVVIPPLALNGPCLTVRKFRDRVFTLDELRALGTVDGRLGRFLADAVRSRKNIAVSGGTGSGKTTLLNALSKEIPHEERIVTIEDAAELRFDGHPDVVRLEARPGSTEGVGEVTIRDLVVNALRMRPDRIVVGECRNTEALDMLQAMNTGHDGSLTTLHANSPADVVSRLVTMVRFGSDLPVDAIERQIASAIDLIVHIARQPDGGRRVVEVAECAGYADGVVLRELVRWEPSEGAYRWSDGADGQGARPGAAAADDPVALPVSDVLDAEGGKPWEP